uniref:Uncharacterized protein n=1 Tax=viral metagenome TaxID=1070528 RepID=A0A6C0E0P0_9ZZZZ
MIAIKFPKICDNIGLSYIDINKLEIKQNINKWIETIYKNNIWLGWLVYNDQTNHIKNERNNYGHCKGIFSWNDTAIGWLVHSVPQFPAIFNDNIISEIDKSELIYGQSFIYLEIEKTQDNFLKLLNQLFNMRPHIYISNNFSEDVIIYNNISNYKINDKIFHISKSNVNHIDIYKYITSQFGGSCNAETWIRGKHYEKTDDINDLTEINKKDAIYHYTETHDHSKIALSIDPDNPWIFVGDLNRMTSQLTRGGGGFVIIDDKLWSNLNKFIF